MPFQEHFLFWAYTQFSSWQLVNVRYKRANYINIFGISINFLFFSSENFRTKVELNRIVLRRWIFKSVYLHLHQFFGLCFEIETRAFSLRHIFFKQESKHMCERPQMTHRSRRWSSSISHHISQWLCSVCCS